MYRSTNMLPKLNNKYVFMYYQILIIILTLLKCIIKYMRGK